MDIKKLDQEIERILSSNLSTRDYGDIKQELVNLGYDQAEQQYILREIDEKGLMPAAKSLQNPGRAKMILGAALCFISLVVVASLYMGPTATAKEVYYVALVLFAIGYYILRSGIRKSNQSAKERKE